MLAWRAGGWNSILSGGKKSVVLLSTKQPSVSCCGGMCASAHRPPATSCGAVGLLAAHCAFARGAERVILIDKE